MRIPNFKSEEGSILYKNTVGNRISPRVADVLLKQAKSYLTSLDVTAILDLGCGPGTLCLPLAREYPRLNITAADSSDSMISLAKTEAQNQHLQNIHFMQIDAGHIALVPETFDLVLCNLAFPFFAKPYDSMTEVFAAVRPGGSVCFTVPGHDTWDEFFTVAASVLGDMVSMARPFLTKFSQAEVLPDAMSKAGFRDISEERTRLPFHFASGQDVLEFFAELFHLLDYATADMRSELADAIDNAYPNGFTMHYEAVLFAGRR